jgi:putative FmdB family regulatory protein
MPIYEYRCDDGHTFEVRQRMADDPVETCVNCERPVRRVFHPVAVHFKGSGFYSTDYGKRNRGQGEGEGEGPAKSDEGGGSKKSDDGGASSPQKGSSGEGKGSGGESKGSSDSGSKATSGSSSSSG